MKHLHRHDGFLTIATKENGRYRDRGSIPAADLEMMIPEFAEALLVDSYYSIHGFYRAGHGNRKLAGKDIPAPYRKSDGVRYLTSAFVDLDIYNAGYTTGQAVGEIVELEQSGKIPSPSCIVYSGRGVWCLWLLRDRENPEKAVRAHDRLLPMWHRVQNELYRRLEHLGADPLSRDLSRVTRIPGSVNSRSEEINPQVSYRWLTDQGGAVCQYTLDDMFRALDLKSFVDFSILQNENPIRKEPEKKSNRARGWKALHKKRLSKLDHLEALRGGWQEGHRERALFLMGVLMKRSGTPIVLITEAIQRSGRISGLPGNEINSLIRYLFPEKKIQEKRKSEGLEPFPADQYKRIKDKKLVEWLSITPEELETMDWHPRLDDYWSRENRENRSLSRTQQIRHRRELIRQAPPDLSIRGIMAYLEQKHGLSVSFRTVKLDLEAIGKDTPLQAASKRGDGQGVLFE